MLTQEKIKIFVSYKGDSDFWERCVSNKENNIMSSNDWNLIESLIQDLFLIKKGLTSLDFDSNLNKKLKENCDNDETVIQLKLASEYIYKRR